MTKMKSEEILCSIVLDTIIGGTTNSMEGLNQEGEFLMVELKKP